MFSEEAIKSLIAAALASIPVVKTSSSYSITTVVSRGVTSGEVRYIAVPRGTLFLSALRRFCLIVASSSLPS